MLLASLSFSLSVLGSNPFCFSKINHFLEHSSSCLPKTNSVFAVVSFDDHDYDDDDVDEYDE